MLLLIIGIIALVLLVFCIIMFIQENYESAYAFLGVCAILSLIFGISISATTPTVEDTKETVALYKELVSEYYEGKLSESESNQLALKIKETNDHIDFLMEKQRSLYYGLFISNEKIEKIPIEPWIEEAIKRSILWENN